MGFSTYADLARNRTVRRILLLGLLMRIPMWAAGVVLTLHVVGHLGRSYTEAGVLEMAYSLALAISGPWRGRRLDRSGLRTSLLPSLLVLAACWAIAPWVGYWALLALVAVAGLFMMPTFSIVRQVLLAAVPDHQRTAVLSIDSVVVELSFMIGPVLGVLAVVYLPSSIALTAFQALAVLGGIALWIDNPPLRRSTTPTGGRTTMRSWLSATVVAILLVSGTACLILTGEDLGVVAAMRALEHAGSIGWMLALWGLGSAIGGVTYGALPRHPPAAVLLVALAGTTALVAVADGRAEFALVLFVSGLFCAPTITATIDDLTRAVPPQVQGEAMGWHGSAMTLGGAVGAPLVGWAIDQHGWQGGFEIAGGLGLVFAVSGLLVQLRRRHVYVATDAGRAEGGRSLEHTQVG